MHLITSTQTVRGLALARACVYVPDHCAPLYSVKFSHALPRWTVEETRREMGVVETGAVFEGNPVSENLGAILDSRIGVISQRSLTFVRQR